MRMKIAKEEIPTHPVEYLTKDDISALPVLPMTQSADGTWYCDGESTQVVQEQGKNLFDKTKAQDGYIKSDGTVEVVSYVKCTDYVKVSGNYVCMKNCITITSNIRYHAFYDSEKNFISGAVQFVDEKNPDVPVTVDIPENAVYFRCRIELSLIDAAMICVDYTPTEYEPFQPKMPSPDYLSPITNTYTAGTYKAVCGDKVYKVVLDDDLRNVPGTADRVVIDAGRGVMRVERNIGAIEFNGNEKFAIGYNTSENFQEFSLSSIDYNGLNATKETLCNIFPYCGKGNVANSCRQISKTFGLRFIVSTDIVPNKKIDEFKEYLAQRYTDGVPVIFYYVLNPTTHQSIPTQLLAIQSGKSAQILNTVNDKADFLKVRGDSWQKVQEKGKNMIDNNPAKWKIGYNISWHPIEGTAWVYGRSTDKACIEIPVLPNTKYGFFNSDTENYWISRIIESDNDGLGYVNHVFYSNISQNVEQYSFTSTANTTKLVFQLSTTPDSDSNLPDITEDFIRAIQITLEQGEPTKYTAFQPAMPSLEYSSEIKDVGGKMQSCGWNYYSGGDVEGTQNENSGTIQTIPPGTYTFTADVESSDTDNTKCFILFYNGTIMLNGVTIGRGKGAQTTVTISENVTKFTCYASNSSLNSLGDTFSFRNIQIVKGDTTHPYDRHRGNSITLPTLRGLPDGTRDVLYVDRKAKRAWVERKVWTDILDGSDDEDILFFSQTVGNFVTVKLSHDAIKYKKPLCNYFVGKTSAGYEKGITINHLSRAVILDDVVIQSLDYFKEWISNNNVIVQYALATPVIEELPYSDYMLDTCQWETNISFVDCDENLNPEITAIIKTLGNL